MSVLDPTYINGSDIVDRIKDKLLELAYNQGHSAGQEEVQSIYDGLLADFREVLTDTETLEAWAENASFYFS